MAGRTARVIVTVEDVNGSFRRMINESPKMVRKFLSTAVFETAGAVRREMEALVEVGPEGQGLTPIDHIKFDIEHRGKTGSLHAQVGIFDDPDQVTVATFNEWNPNRQAFMRPAARAQSEPFKARAIDALQRCARAIAQSSGVSGGKLPRQRREGRKSSGVSRFTTSGRL